MVTWELTGSSRACMHGPNRARICTTLRQGLFLSRYYLSRVDANQPFIITCLILTNKDLTFVLQTDLAAIKAMYRTKYHVGLVSHIEEFCSGDFEDILVKLLNPNIY